MKIPTKKNICVICKKPKQNKRNNAHDDCELEAFAERLNKDMYILKRRY